MSRSWPGTRRTGCIPEGPAHALPAWPAGAPATRVCVRQLRPPATIRAPPAIVPGAALRLPAISATARLEYRLASVPASLEPVPERHTVAPALRSARDSSVVTDRLSRPALAHCCPPGGIAGSRPRQGERESNRAPRVDTAAILAACRTFIATAPDVPLALARRTFLQVRRDHFAAFARPG